MLRRFRTVALTLLAVAALNLALAPAGRAQDDDICPERNDGFDNSCKIGRPGQDGTTVKGFLNHEGDVDAYQFEVGPNASSVHITLADLWVDTDISLYETLTGRLIAQAKFIAESRRTGEAQSQMSAPEMIVERLEPTSYTTFIYSGDLKSADERGYTFRIALGPPIVPQANIGGQDASKKDGYQLSIAIEPEKPTQFSMVTINAFIDPSFTDLFDFQWEIDGQAVPDNNVPLLQFPATALGDKMIGRHTVKVTAIGAREYPDPDRPHIPPTLVATASFEVVRAQ